MPDFKTEKAIILGVKNLGERSYVVSLLTQENGRYLGVYKGKKPPQIADIVSARWQARLNEQLGTFYLEHLKSTAAPFLDDWARLCALKSLCEILNVCLPERQKYENVYHHMLLFFNKLNKETYVKDYILFELFLLSELGFALDLTSCAGGGDKNNLTYVSPKTGHAVSQEMGRPYHDKLLPLPAFFIKEVAPSFDDLKNGLNLTGYFLTKHALKHFLPPERKFLLKRK